MIKQRHPVNRRQFFQGLVSAVAVIPLPSAKASAKMLEYSLDDLIAELASDRSLIDLGNNYLSKYRNPEEFVRMESDLRDSVERAFRSVPGDGDLRLRAERSIRLDFDRNRICVLDGWWLSQTEVELCALAALHV